MMMDKFFDCLNVRNTKKFIIKGKSFLEPYESVNDIRFARLDEFLQNFKSWKESSETRNDANYTENAKSKIYISWLSYEGLQIFVTTRYPLYLFRKVLSG